MWWLSTSNLWLYWTAKVGSMSDYQFAELNSLMKFTPRDVSWTKWKHEDEGLLFFSSCLWKKYTCMQTVAVDACCSMINSICIISVSSSVCMTVAGPLHCQLAFVSPSPRNSPVKSYVNVTYPHWRAHWHTHHNTSADHRFQATFISCFRAVNSSHLWYWNSFGHWHNDSTSIFSFFFSIQKKIHKRKQLKM